MGQEYKEKCEGVFSCQANSHCILFYLLHGNKYGQMYNFMVLYYEKMYNDR